jgi:hypothetical protein
MCILLKDLLNFHATYEPDAAPLRNKNSWNALPVPSIDRLLATTQSPNDLAHPSKLSGDTNVNRLLSLLKLE